MEPACACCRHKEPINGDWKSDGAHLYCSVACQEYHAAKSCGCFGGGHRWSGWPGAWCLDCGCEDPRELELAHVDVSPDHPGYLGCAEPNSKRHDPYAARVE